MATGMRDTARYVTRRFLSGTKITSGKGKVVEVGRIKDENTADIGGKLRKEYLSLLKKSTEVTEEYVRAMTSSSMGSKARGSSFSYTKLPKTDRLIISGCAGVVSAAGILFFGNRS